MSSIKTDCQTNKETTITKAITIGSLDKIVKYEGLSISPSFPNPLEPPPPLSPGFLASLPSYVKVPELNLNS